MELQEKLLDKKRELQRSIDRKKDSLMITVRESTDDLSMYDQHPADLERLERLIYTTQCIQCARKAKDNFTRPAEEDISFSGAMSDRGETLEIAGYDFYDSDN